MPHLNDGLGRTSGPPPSLGSMNLARHAAVLWRFRAVTATGLLLGILLAVLASYKISFAGGPSLVARGTSTYNSESQILVTQNGFPEGRVTLPDAPILGNGGESDPKSKVDPNRIEYGDPNRFNALADLYTQFLTSDQVRDRVPEKPKPSQITASPLPATSGAPILPIISLATTAESSKGAHQLNLHMLDALRGLLEEQQDKAGIAPAARVRLDVMKAAQPGSLLSGPSHTASILALLLAVIGTIAVTHLLASLRSGDVDEADDEWLEDGQPQPVNGNGNGRTHSPTEVAAGKRLSAVAGGSPADPPDAGYWGAR